MHARIPQPSADLPFPGYAPLDIANEPPPHDLPAHDALSHDPFPAGPFSPRMVWSADDLVQAVRLPLHREAFAPSANDARLHRPRRTLRFAATPALAPRFRVGG